MNINALKREMEKTGKVFCRSKWGDLYRNGAT